MLRVKTTPPAALPPCPARTFPNGAGTQGVLPAALPAGTKTVFLLNRERLNRLYGQPPPTRCGRRRWRCSPGLEIAGALLEVDGDAAVRAAYAAWDASPCNTEAANAVVRAINAVVAQYRAQTPQLRYVVILGTDEALPMARISDPTTISNETDEAADLEFTTSGLTKGNALHAAAARAKFLSDARTGHWRRSRGSGASSTCRSSRSAASSRRRSRSSASSRSTSTRMGPRPRARR